MENLDLSPTLTAEQEVPQAENVNPMAELMDSSFGFEPLSSGSVRKGTIVRMTPTEILVDLSLIHISEPTRPY